MAEFKQTKSMYGSYTPSNNATGYSGDVTPIQVPKGMEQMTVKAKPISVDKTYRATGNVPMRKF